MLFNGQIRVRLKVQEMTEKWVYSYNRDNTVGMISTEEQQERKGTRKRYHPLPLLSLF